MSCPAETPFQPATGNLLPLLHEVRHALARLAAGQSSTVIDLRGIPFAPGEEQELERLLGRGETRIDIDALGPTEVLETAIGGVWLVTHRNAEGDIVGRFIEICRIPEIVQTPAADIDDGLAEITRMLANE
jgi:hydrogenase-1 operon protein HyaF